jgi:ABC-type multidrug transport system ATPase subunit
LAKCKKAAEEMLKDVDLEEKRNARSASLSGGQKRKLSIGIAFIGGSRLVLLDEPTAGMDVHTRRYTWDLVQRMARDGGRAIILTTHFMDEAELLGDRVAMMAAGQLHSYGSTTYLKSTLGQSYTLNIQYTGVPTEDTRKEALSHRQAVRAEREGKGFPWSRAGDHPADGRRGALRGHAKATGGGRDEDAPSHRHVQHDGGDD